MALRYALLMGHPRKQLNFSLDSLHAADSAVKQLQHYRTQLATQFGFNLPECAPSNLFQPAIVALRDDLNFPAAFGAVFSAMRKQSADDASTADLVGFQQTLFAMGFDKLEMIVRKIEKTPDNILALADKRWAAKQAKDWAGADALRKELTAAGWNMLDGKDGYKLEPAKK